MQPASNPIQPGETGLVRSQLLERRRRLAAMTETLPDAVQLLVLLQEVDSALERMDGGRYGLCSVCHDPVEAEVLAVDPLACQCLDHMSESDRRALEQDLELAQRIQVSLLPERSVEAAGWTAGYHYQAAGAVGGDYCDLQAAGGALFFAVGDVSGKGVAASLLVSHLHAAFRSLLSIGLPLADVVDRANRLLCESTAASHYATLACGRALPGGEIELCNAGHCPPLWLANGETASVAATGLPLGLFMNARYAVTRLGPAASGRLVLYTDGATEARDASGEEYGEERLAACLRQSRGARPGGVIEAVVADVARFASGRPFADDLTLMVVDRAAG